MKRQVTIAVHCRTCGAKPGVWCYATGNTRPAMHDPGERLSALHNTRLEPDWKALCMDLEDTIVWLTGWTPGNVKRIKDGCRMGIQDCSFCPRLICHDNTVDLRKKEEGER